MPFDQPWIVQKIVHFCDSARKMFLLGNIYWSVLVSEYSSKRYVLVFDCNYQYRPKNLLLINSHDLARRATIVVLCKLVAYTFQVSCQLLSVPLLFSTNSFKTKTSEQNTFRCLLFPMLNDAIKFMHSPRNVRFDIGYATNTFRCNRNIMKTSLFFRLNFHPFVLL